MERERRVRVTLPDGSTLELPEGTSVAELATRIGPGLGQACVAGEVDGRVVDRRFPLVADGRVRILTPEDPESLSVLRHSAAHVMAMAVKRLRPGVHLAFGPPVEDGFYYDFETEEPFREEDFASIEEEMRRIVAEDLPYERHEYGKEEARRILSEMGEDLKFEHLSDIPGDTVSFYRSGDFQDLCEGPHLASTGQVRAFRLLRTSAAYWKGNAENAALSRIYGTAFFSEKELEAHLRMLEERTKRDHRRIGVETGLFSFHPEAPGQVFWHEKGATLYGILLDYFYELHRARGYRLVRTPLVMSEELWKRSGHYDHYKDHMFFVDLEEGRFALKPMNCPGHNLIYRSEMHSYRDLPLRVAEMGLVHRNELSGVLGGLTRVRSFSIDDAHIYCAPQQLRDEIIGVMEIVHDTYRDFGFPDVEVELSTRPETGSIGSGEMWERATDALREALEAREVSWVLNPGEGAFYGPKIDFHLRDSLNRRWQCGTIQVDFAMPERFDLEYVASDGSRRRPVMVHRAVFGSPERFIAVLLEHFAGKLPVWLAPVQIVVMNITDVQAEYGRGVVRRLREVGLRVQWDSRNEKIGRKIRDAVLQKVPYMLIVGGREMGERTVSVRSRDGGDLGSFPVGGFEERVLAEVRERRT